MSRAAALARYAMLGLAALALVSCKDEGSARELCRTLDQHDDLVSTFDDFDPADPEQALDQFRTARVTLGDLHAAAPEEVRDELQVEIDYVQAAIDALEDVEPGDATESALQIQAVTDAHPGVRDAASTLARYAAQECD